MPPTTPQSAPPPPNTIAQLAAQPRTGDGSKNDIYAIICSQIIKEQGLIIGNLTYKQASQVPGLHVDPYSYNCTLDGDGKQVIAVLVEKYREFFGNAAVEVCREAAAHFTSQLPEDELPTALRK